MNKATYTLVGSLLVLSVFSRVGYADPAGKVGYVHDVNVEKGQSERLRTLIFPLMLKEHVKAVYEQAGNTVPTYVYHDELTSDGLKIKMLGKSAIVATYLITTGDLKSQGFCHRTSARHCTH